MGKNTVVAVLTVMFFASFSLAGQTGQYVYSSEGVKGGTLPPPGLYYRMYNTFYCADKIKDGAGDHLQTNFKLHVLANVHRLIWVTDANFFGADFFCDVVVPNLYTNIDYRGIGLDDHDWGWGNINIEPFGLAWHGPRYDIGLGQSVYLPTGEYDKNNAASPGKDFWTWMSTLGGTYYLDPERTLSASILCRYEVHSKRKHSDIRLGRDFGFDWGVSKVVNKNWELGVAGYCKWQLSKDNGDGVVWDRSVRDKVYAIGPEIGYANPEKKLFITLRWLREFDAVDTSQGNVTTLTLTKMF